MGTLGWSEKDILERANMINKASAEILWAKNKELGALCRELAEVLKASERAYGYGCGGMLREAMALTEQREKALAKYREMFPEG